MKQEQRSLGYRIWIFVFTIFLGISALWVTLNRDAISFDRFKRWLRYGELQLSEQGLTEPFPHAGGDMASFAFAQQGVLMVSQSGGRYYSLTGESFAERAVSFKNPVLHAGSQNTVLYDAGGKVLLVYGEQEEKFSLSFGSDSTVLSARMNSNDWMVVVTQSGGYKGVVTVYNKDFQPIMDISLSTTYITDAYISPDNKKLAIITIGQEKGEFYSNLLVFALGQQAEPLEECSFLGQVILDMNYEKDHIWLLCEKQLIIVDTSTFEQEVFLFSGQYLKNYTLTGDGFATLLLGKYRAGTANTLVTVGATGEILAEQSITSSPLSVSSAGNYLAYLSGEQFILYNSKLEELGVLDEIGHANEISVSEDGTVLLSSKQDAWLFVPNH